MNKVYRDNFEYLRGVVFNPKHGGLYRDLHALKNPGYLVSFGTT